MRPLGMQEEVSLLVSALVDDAITETELARLNRLIESDPAARALYVRFMHQHADLAELPCFASSEVSDVDAIHVGEGAQHCAAEHCRLSPAIESLPQRILRIARKPSYLSLMTAVAVVGVLICGLALVAIPRYWQSVTQLTEQRLVVAKITRVHQPRWHTKADAREPNQELFAGDRIDLNDGFVEIYFHSGASVIVQGPSRFSVVSPSLGRLDVGTLTAAVPAKAVGFSIRTPSAKVVDLGTEFGLQVEKDGATAVDVFTGRVEITWVDAAKPPSQRVTLSAGEAARVAVGGDGIKRVDEGWQEFVRAKALNELIAESAFERWRTHSDSLKTDPNVVALYDFIQQDATPDLLHNVAHPGRFDGTINGPVWTTGRWQEKQALRFERADECVHFDFSGETCEQLTLSAWVHVDWLVHPLTAVFYSDDWTRPGAVHWTIQSDGRVELAIFGNEPAVVQSDPVMLQRRTGRWIHLAVVYDTRQLQSRFYVNGVNRGTRTYSKVLPADLQKAQLGDWNPSERNLTGMIDELIIFRTALSSEQIQKIYQAGVP